MFWWDKEPQVYPQESSGLLEQFHVRLPPPPPPLHPSPPSSPSDFHTKSSITCCRHPGSPPTPTNSWTPFTPFAYIFPSLSPFMLSFSPLSHSVTKWSAHYQMSVNTTTHFHRDAFRPHLSIAFEEARDVTVSCRMEWCHRLSASKFCTVLVHVSWMKASIISFLNPLTCQMLAKLKTFLDSVIVF